jgi:environmental stress-induced protein Ves
MFGITMERAVQEGARLGQGLDGEFERRAALPKINEFKLRAKGGPVRAMVVEDGAFSIFSGIARNLTVLSGSGFDLVGQGIHLAARPLEPVAFAGDIALRAVGVAEPCEDFNVMTAADLPPAQVTVHPAGATAQGALLALAAGQIGGVAVAQYDVVLTDEPLLAHMPVIAVQAVGL